VYEPEMDGFRCAAYRQPRCKVTLQSRQQRPITRYFPDVAEACGSSSSAGWCWAASWCHRARREDGRDERQHKRLEADPVILRLCALACDVGPVGWVQPVFRS
jgi:hypothetical protein